MAKFTHRFTVKCDGCKQYHSFNCTKDDLVSLIAKALAEGAKHFDVQDIVEFETNQLDVAEVM